VSSNELNREYSKGYYKGKEIGRREGMLEAYQNVLDWVGIPLDEEVILETYLKERIRELGGKK